MSKLPNTIINSYVNNSENAGIELKNWLTNQNISVINCEHLSHLGIRPNQLIEMAEIIAGTQVTKVSFNNNNLGLHAIKLAQNLIKPGSKIENVDLGFNKLREYAIEVTEILTNENSQVNTLNLCCNSLGAHAIKISELVTNPDSKIVSVGLSANFIKEHADRVVEDLAKKNSLIHTVDLSANFIDKNLISVFKILTGPDSSVQSINFDMNQIPENDIIPLANLLANPSSHVHTVCFSNQLGSQEAEFLKIIIAKNSPIMSIKPDLNLTQAQKRDLWVKMICSHLGIEIGSLKHLSIRAILDDLNGKEDALYLDYMYKFIGISSNTQNLKPKSDIQHFETLTKLPHYLWYPILLQAKIITMSQLKNQIDISEHIKAKISENNQPISGLTQLLAIHFGHMQPPTPVTFQAPANGSNANKRSHEEGPDPEERSQKRAKEDDPSNDSRCTIC